MSKNVSTSEEVTDTDTINGTVAPRALLLPTAGSILLSDTDATSIHLGTYRSSIALVQQKPVLYQGSIRDNIALGLLNPDDPDTESKLVEACKQSNIHTFHRLHARGAKHAEGQRITIARALVRWPKLLLLDEATSSLDTESEIIVQRALDRAMGGAEDDEGEKKGASEEERKKRRRTTLAVAHRLSTVKDADAIYVFAQGLVVESGTHD